MKKKALDRDSRKRQILLLFSIELTKGNDGWFTVADIARRLELTASGKLRAIIHELVAEGCLTFFEEGIPGCAKIRRVYMLTDIDGKPEVHDGSKKGRAIVINCRQGSFFERLGE